MKILFSYTLLSLCALGCEVPQQAAPVITGAEQTEAYLDLLQQKRVGILTNHTAVIGETHLVDSLLSLGVDIQTIYAPEHGFRGAVGAGGYVGDDVDPTTGIPIVSLYRIRTMPTDSMMREHDVMIYDIQDVGLRFYTYMTSMYYLMEACARNNVPLIILDRPNPNGHYVDGPILDMELTTFAGIIPVPVVHGLTLGELAGMINGEKWLKDGLQCDVTVIKCKNYTHHTLYELPVIPSPALPNMRSIYLYPSLCLFEGTPISMGRRTDFPFQVYGHPQMTDCDFNFTLQPRENNPDQELPVYYGVDLRTEPSNKELFEEGLTVKYVIHAFQNLNENIQIGESFFRRYFDQLIGATYPREMILAGKSAEEIKECWKQDVENFKNQRAPYLLYPL
ncbi:MAG: DUF1343 domain-containing protein [Prevotellaceae bacterium]|jgi:uncharacterized protein YbbC (DUF1343 family)|nr:DUF1343 domain-containing protein [Prevotellaceae bacterium]